MNVTFRPLRGHHLLPAFLFAVALLTPQVRVEGAEPDAGRLPGCEIPEFSANERTGLARAYIELAEEGFPGPGLTDFPRSVLACALDMLERVPVPDRLSDHSDLVLRGCLLLARQQRVFDLRLESPPGSRDVSTEGTDLPAYWLARCRDLAGAVPPSERASCAAAGIRAALGPLSPDDVRRVEARCERSDSSAVLADVALRNGELDRINLQLPDVEGSWSQREYGVALGAAARAQRRQLRIESTCRERGDCASCRTMALHKFLEGAEAEGVAAVEQLVGKETTPCVREAATLLAWRQDWDNLDRLVPQTRAPAEAWWHRLVLYRELSRLAAAQGLPPDDGLLGQRVEAACEAADGCPLLQVAVFGLLWSAEVYAGRRLPRELVAWVHAQSVRPEVLSAGAPAMSALLTLLSPVGEESDADLVMNRFLLHPANSGDCPMAQAVAIELLVTAILTRDVVRLQKARVMIERGLRSCADDAQRQVHIEYLSIMARWADARQANETQKGLGELKNQLERLLGQKGGLMDPVLRGAASLNYLAALVRIRNPSGVEIDSRLHEAVERDVPYHLLWIHRLLGDKRVQPAIAVARLCELAASSAAERAACLRWQAALQRYVGHDRLAGSFEAEAAACSGLQQGSDERTGVSCNLAGDRRLRIVLDREGELHVETGFSPRFLIILLPQAGLPISPSNSETGAPETPGSCPSAPKP